MPIIQTIYSVTITNSAGSNAAPADGFIDPTSVAQYAANNSIVSDLAHSLAKTRANIRYRFMIQQLQSVSNLYILDFVAVGADANTQPTSLTFNVVSDAGDQNIYAYDETNSNALLTGIPALTRMLARALVEGRIIESSYFDPTITSAPGTSALANRNGSRIDQIVVGGVYANLATAATNITISKIV